VAARSKAWVCGRSLAGIVGLNPAGGVIVCLWYSVCVVRWSLCDGLITRPEESYRVWCVWVWSWTSILRWPWPSRGCCTTEKKITSTQIVPSMRQINPVQVLPSRWKKNFNSIVFSHLFLCPRCGFFSSDFPSKALYACSFSTVHATCNPLSCNSRW
jgi:hypothetical protein